MSSQLCRPCSSLARGIAQKQISSCDHFNGALARHELTSSLAEEYGLELVYKEPFANILAQEQESRDFGGLLTKMGVLNYQGESAMDADQWEAASRSWPCRPEHA